MWITGKPDPAFQKDMMFNELFSECRSAAPGARLSYPVRNKLERISHEERKDIVSRVQEGCAPLFIACKKGNLEIVDYLVTRCGSDIEQRGVYEVPEDRSIHFVTPLWCAAVAGKLNVVQLLVTCGANVNSVSDTGSTPVRSACFMTHNDIVSYLIQQGADILRPNYNGGTCLINSVQSAPLCKYLLSCGADVNAQDVQFKTALHYAIQEHRFDTTQLLIEHNANPYLRSRYGDDALQTACLKGSKEIFEYLLTTLDYPPARIADAYELIGTTFLDEHHDLPATLQCWRKALSVRETYNVPKANPTGPFRKAYHQAHVNAEEFRTLEELNLMAVDMDVIRNQSLLICERILGPLHKDTIYRLMFRGAAYADDLQYQRCIDLWKYAVELRIIKDSVLHSESAVAAMALVRLCLDMYEKHQAGVMREKLDMQDVTDIITLLVEQLAEAMSVLVIRPVSKRQQDNFDKILKVVTHLFYILNALPKEDEKDMRRLVAHALAQDPRNSAGDSLLHLVVSKSNVLKQTNFLEDTRPALFPDEKVSRLLLECGADVEATNHSMSTPLHVASLRNNYRPAVVKVLLEHGAHVDRRNGNGNQPHRMLQGIPECNLNPLHYVTLSCLAARKIMERRIRYIGEVPVSLEGFIRLH
ncbi:protein fem-1 homolog C-like [Ornithodoros turicata]|uniref:protein fem-1 homolog C-like n=1 Tax=Ornithodoros turicata TaxID=34597 RepID=UPI0031386D01